MFKTQPVPRLIFLSMLALCLGSAFLQTAQAANDCAMAISANSLTPSLSSYLTITSSEVFWKGPDQTTGIRIPVSAHQCKMLLFMFEHMDEVLTYEQIYDHVWPANKFVKLEDKKEIVLQQVNQIRSIFKKVIPTFSSITNIFGQGYRLRSQLKVALDFNLDNLRITPTRVYWNEEEVGKGKLSHEGKARQLLLLLTKRVGTDVSYEEMIEVVWPEYVGRSLEKCESAIWNLVTQLRKAFRKIDPSFDRIRNGRGLSYSWTVKPNSIFVEYAGFEFNPSTYRFRRKGQEFRLTPVHARLFLALIRSSPNVVPRNQLLKELNPSLGPGKLSRTAEKSLEVQMSTLRSALFLIDQGYGEIRRVDLDGFAFRI